MPPPPVVPHEIDWLGQLLEFAGKPIAISVNRTVKAGGNGGAKSGWGQANNVVVAQMRDEVVPDGFRFRTSVNENDGHPNFFVKIYVTTVRPKVLRFKL